MSDTCRDVTVSIDFGTSFTGCAFAFDSNLSQVHVVKWTVGSSETDKAPTTILLKEDKTFATFGYKAESKYAKLCDLNRQKGWRYFQNFKKVLYEQEEISEDTTIPDSENKPMLALEIFSAALAYLKKKLLHAIKLKGVDVKDDVLYVITVPGIWSDDAKKFMRKAATNTKVFCQRDSSVKLTDVKGVLLSNGAFLYAGGASYSPRLYIGSIAGIICYPDLN